MKDFFKISQFDEVTQFRLINNLLIAISLGMFFPMITIIKGQYLLAWVISMFMIFQTLAVKTNRFMVANFDIGQIFRLGIFVHVLIILSTGIYFYDQFTMIVLDSILGIIDTIVFSVYSIQLNNYITEKFPENMNEFQLVRNSIWADGSIIGLGLAAVISFFFPMSISILTFIVFYSLFTLWLFTNWNFYLDKN